ncbi:sensor histidine kinase [Pseudonocardia broussonetiae]|uniref:Sensor histidine kinase n=1 Tax=Pseudonocardia broussonetiae TaxID=2736640 RepID=A0A6M6JFX9_9PSEU|nr:histidine kinase [Pseudonocardia broussonetiae]QJY45940.1 sensor histidine kinase [Pseudonocardia broussonetiae]
MDTSPPGFEERRVRTARRFGRIGLASTLLYLFLVPVPLFLGAVRPDLVVVVVVLYVVGFGLHLWRIRELMRSLGTPAAPWFSVAASVVGLAVTVVGLGSGALGFTWSLLGGVLLGDVVGGRRARTTAIWVVAASVLTAVLGWWATGLVHPPGADSQSFRAFSVGLAVTYVGAMWILDVERLWWLKAVIDIDGSRRTAAELATARERLRLADDLHDILGHALEVVAFKSELAARLPDHERARAEMVEVQRVARESLTEVRSLVRDTRTIDLVTELAGARAVLGSSGITLVVHGDPAAVGPTARTVLGRVLREAMTNVLRHAEPSHCTIEIDVDGDAARLVVVNDGALPTDDADPGTGLASLGRYLDEHAGRLAAGPAGDGTFRIDASLPAGAR